MIGNRVIGHTTPSVDVGASGGGINTSGPGSSTTLYNSRVLNNGAVAVGDEDSLAGGVAALNGGQAVNSLIANNRTVSNVDARAAGWFGNLTPDQQQPVGQHSHRK